MSFAPWQHEVYSRLERNLREGRLAHALLFTGPARMGKSEVAHALAARLLCQAPVPEPSPHPALRAPGPDASHQGALRVASQGLASDPHRPGGRGGVGAERESLADTSAMTVACGACRACSLLRAGTHPDFQHVTYEPTEKGDKLRTELVVDQVRRLGEWFSKTSQFGGAQVVVVEPAEMLNTAAANALLKTLEEPSGNRYLLLVTSRPARLPATIRSRCQRLEFALPGRDTARAWLVARGHKPDAVEAALDAARGHPGLADAWIAHGGLALRAQVQAELDAVGRGKASPIETAQRWLADEHGEQRLRFAADLAVDGVAQALGARAAPRDALVVKADAARIAAWFDAVNAMRAQLPAPLRHDLILAGLLRDWRTMLATGPGPGQGGQQR